MSAAADSPRTASQRIAWGLALPSVATALIVTLPLLYLFVRAWEVGWHEYRSLLLSTATLRLLGDTLLLVVGVVSLALAIALPPLCLFFLTRPSSAAPAVMAIGAIVGASVACGIFVSGSRRFTDNQYVG